MSLLVVVALLLAIGLMALTAFTLSRGQYQLVGNIQYQEQAFQQAETASAIAENWLTTTANSRLAAFDTYSSATPGLYPEGKMTELGRDPKTMVWTDSNSVTAGSGRYVIERIARSVKQPGASLQVAQKATAACRSVDLFRVISRSSSTRGSSRLIETYVATDGCL